MEKKKRGNRYPTEVRARAIRMVLDDEEEYSGRSSAIASISDKFGCS